MTLKRSLAAATTRSCSAASRTVIGGPLRLDAYTQPVRALSGWYTIASLRYEVFTSDACTR